jgi:hypothetical protein
MSDDKLADTALTLVFLMLGQRGVDVLVDKITVRTYKFLEQDGKILRLVGSEGPCKPS